MVYFIRSIAVCSLLLLLALFGSCNNHSCEGESPLADTLCSSLADARYKEVSAIDSLATALLELSEDDNHLRMVACNSMAYSALMAMDYANARTLYDSVLVSSECEIERLVADVGLMTLCYRVSENRSFFDYRASALERIKRINEDSPYLSDSDRARFYRAKIEFGIVSICYFSNLAMLDEKQMALEYLNTNIGAVDDVSLKVYARMIIANNTADAQSRLNALMIGLTMSRNLGLTWLEANYELLLAISLRGNDVLEKWNEESPEKLDALAPRTVDVENIPLYLAGAAIDNFKAAGDNYMMIEAMSVYASCQTQLGNYEGALEMLDSAVTKVNEYYSMYYPDLDKLYSESLEGDSSYVIHHPDGANGIYFILECMLSIRREASCAYAGLNDIYNSNFSRDVYIGILNIIRDNKMLESRTSIVETDLSRLAWLALLFGSLLVLVAVCVVLSYSRRMRYDRRYSNELKRLPGVCRLLLTELPEDVTSKEDLCVYISGILDKALAEFSEGIRFYIASQPIVEEGVYCYEHTLEYLNSSEHDKLYVTSLSPLTPEKQSLIAMVVPYISVAVEEGLRLANISDEQERLEEMRKAYAIYLSEHKRDNLVKRVSVSVVMGMRPFMDRILNELRALPAAASPEDSLRKLKYIEELTDKLDDLNVILERWIKMRQGELNLKIENFSLQELFAIVGKSAALLSTRGIDLSVNGGDSYVKADKALTLFMINTLVDNASKFTPAGGRISITGNECNDYVEIAVEDTGIGMSQSDIDRILNEKVYDAARIGEDNENLPAKSKGGGFGLMNCKGIIDKYRKTDSIFSVCSLDITSSKGKGSRFAFRLPKGVRRLFAVLLLLLPTSLFASDDIFTRIDACVDSMLQCNIESDYNATYVQAQKAIDLLNTYYKQQYPGGVDTLLLNGGGSAELRWWNAGLFADSLSRREVYVNIVDIRNEMAIASMMLLDWNTYRYNNYIYTTLVAKLKEETGVADRYQQARERVNLYNIVIALSCFLLFLMLLYYVISYVRHNIIEKTNERLVLDLNRSLLEVAAKAERNSERDLLNGIACTVYGKLGESMRITAIEMLFRSGNDNSVSVVVPGDVPSQAEPYLYSVMKSGAQYVSPDSKLRVLPLTVVTAADKEVVGAIAVVSERPLSDNECVALELVSGYAASVAYHAVVRVASSYTALDEVEESAERMMFEENRLHVQNMVMDNCLSVIKHETIYYPSRIRDLVQKAIENVGDSDTSVVTMRELMDYYSSVFGILSNCAKRELDEMSFSLLKVELSTLFATAQGYVKRRSAKRKLDISLWYDPTDIVVSVDVDYATFLFESLLDAALKDETPGVLQLRAVDSGSVARVELIDPRRTLSSEEAAELFTPSKYNITPDGGVDRMEYLVAKEVVRLNEDFMGRRGGRMEARSDASGIVILFTLPK